MVPPDESHFAVGTVGIVLDIGVCMSVYCILFYVMSCHLSMRFSLCLTIVLSGSIGPWSA